jgi:Dolichyl-phosphate-mannose-protein mannosyltransferase
MVVVLLVAAWFRTYRLDTVPPGPHFDAVINGQIVDELILPALPAWLRPATASSAIPWLKIQANPNGPDLQEHGWLYHVTLAASLQTIGRNTLGMRFPDVLWGMLGVSACYALARRLFGHHAALVAALAQAVSFWSVFVGRAGLRAGTLVPLLALSACAFWDAWQKRGGGLHRFALSGVLLGLSIYGYLSARPMVLAFITFAAYLGLVRRVEWRRLLAGMGAFLAAGAVVAAPLVLYLNAHPEENLRFNMLSSSLQDLVAGRPTTALQTTLATLGMFTWRGDPQWQYNVAHRPVFDPVGALLFLAGVALTAWRWRRPSSAFALIWLAVGLAPGMLSAPAPHSTRTIAAQVVVYVFLGIGASELLALARRAAPGWLQRLGYAGLAAWWMGFAGWNYQGYFNTWASNDEVRFYHQAAVTEMARYLDRRGDTTPVAACSAFLNEYEDFFRSPRQTIPYLLQRTDLAIRWFDCRDSFVIPSGGRARVILLDFDPSMMDNAISGWVEGSTPVHDDLLSDGTLYRLDAASLPAMDALSPPLSSQVEWSPEAGVSGPASLPADFDHTLEFLGYRVERAQRQAGKDIRVLTYWRVVQPPPMFLVGFMHMLSDPSHVITQHDRQAMLYDTLQSGDVFVQLFSLTIPDGTPPGPYRLSTGWYAGPTQRRLTVYDGQTPRGDRLMLQEITVRP